MLWALRDFPRSRAFQPTVELEAFPPLYSICPEPSRSWLTNMYGAKKLIPELSCLRWTEGIPVTSQKSWLRRWAGISSIIKYVRARQSGMDIVEIAAFRTESIGCPRWIHVVGKQKTWLIYRKVYRIETATYHLSNHFRNKTPSLFFPQDLSQFALACSRGSRRHLWSLSVCNQILSFGEQTGRTWFFIVMTVFWHK